MAQQGLILNLPWLRDRETETERAREREVQTNTHVSELWVLSATQALMHKYTTSHTKSTYGVFAVSCANTRCLHCQREINKTSQG